MHNQSFREDQECKTGENLQEIIEQFGMKRGRYNDLGRPEWLDGADLSKFDSIENLSLFIAEGIARYLCRCFKDREKGYQQESIWNGIVPQR